MAIIADSIEYVFRNEGYDIYTDRPEDRGGPTKFGVTLAILAKWRGSPVTSEDVKNLTRAEAEQVAYIYFWMPLNLTRLGVRTIATAILDTAFVSGGPATAHMIQRALGLTQDGILGDASINKLNQLTFGQFLTLFLPQLQDRFIKIAIADPRQLPNLLGWLHRSQKLLSLIDS